MPRSDYVGDICHRHATRQVSVSYSRGMRYFVLGAKFDYQATESPDNGRIQLFVTIRAYRKPFADPQRLVLTIVDEKGCQQISFQPDGMLTCYINSFRFSVSVSRQGARTQPVRIRNERRHARQNLASYSKRRSA